MTVLSPDAYSELRVIGGAWQYGGNKGEPGSRMASMYLQRE